MTNMPMPTESTPEAVYEWLSECSQAFNDKVHEYVKEKQLDGYRMAFTQRGVTREMLRVWLQRFPNAR